jgi:4-amino-4-deoxy-L-arabinose transferase-like glycosyltransferase
MSGRLPLVLVAAIVALAAALRFGHLGAGIPYAVGVDEPEIMERAVRMMKTGDFNPHFFDWPTLTIYLQFLVSCAVFLLGSMQAHWNHLDQVGAADMFLAGRALSAVIGSATVWVTYLIGRRWGSAEGVIAAALMAVIPYHVRESHYVLADVPTAFLTSLTCLLALRGHERPTTWAFAAAGLSAGLAASSKYNGSIALLFPLLAAWLTEGPFFARVQRTLVISGAAMGGFLAGTPYAWLDLPKFLNDYARLAAIFARERTGEPGWSIYLKHLRGALGWPALVMTFAGMALTVVRAVSGPGRVRWVLLLVFSLVYFRVMAGSYQIYGRYILPLLPMASLMAAIATVAAVGLVRRGRWPGWSIRLSGAAAVLALLAVPAWTSAVFVRDLGRPGTVDLAYRWIDANVPAGSKVVLERRVLLLPAPKYETVNLPSLLTRSYDDFVKDGFDYMVASSFEEPFAAPQDHREAYLAYRELFSRAQMVASFDRSGEVTGPALAVYKLTP